ncbi:MAG TPA: transglutaminase family protein [Arenibaculum sp.]|nr:transglutaminase family protein [Arenibaculum sp.]
MRLEMGCELSSEVEGPSLFILNVEVASIPAHAILAERLVVDPDVERRVHVRPETDNRYVAFTAPAGPLRISYEASVDPSVERADPAGIAEVPLEGVPLSIFHYLLPSRFCPSDRLAAFAAREFGDLPKGHARVTAICNWIYQHIAYIRGTSDAETAATDTIIARAGVCRDFAHLGVALCRGLGIPARFVSCYAPGLEPADFHAVFEAWLGDRWWLFDPTRQAVLDGLVRIGAGRDAAEVSFATIYGAVRPLPPRIRIAPADGAALPPARTTEAIATASC